MDGIVEIAKALKENKSIKELDVSKCQIESEHITSEFIDMLKSQNSALTELYMRDNFIKQQAADQIKEALEINKTLTKNQLDYNPIK